VDEIKVNVLNLELLQAFLNLGTDRIRSSVDSVVPDLVDDEELVAGDPARSNRVANALQTIPRHPTPSHSL
jgi:hypothetical protein